MWNCSPHLETSLELAKKHSDLGDEVIFIFCGHDVIYKEGLVFTPKDAKFITKLPEEIGIKLINYKNKNKIKFYNRIKIDKVEFKEMHTLNSLSDLLDLKYKNFEVGIAVASSLISNQRNSNPSIPNNSKLIKEMIESSISVFEFANKIIKKHKPSLVYLLNGRFCNQRPIMRAAVQNNIKLMFHERGATKNKYDVTTFMPHDQNSVAARINKLWSENKSIENITIGEKYFKDRRVGKEQQGKSYVFQQEKYLLPLINKDKKIITYYSSSDDEFVAVGDVFKWEGWLNQLHAVTELIDICQNKKNIQLIIRLHPNLQNASTDDQNNWLALSRFEHITLIPFDSNIDSYALLDCSDIVITSGSTVGIEAIFWGKPSITLGPAFFSKIGATYNPKSNFELSTLLDDNELTINRDAAIAFGYYVGTFGFNFKFYNPTSLHTGYFLNTDLNKKSLIWKVYVILVGIFKRRISSIRNYFLGL
jgi:hypothetical protein